MQELTIKRFAAKYDATLGNLFLPSGEWLCFTLEDEKRLQKVHGQTCIPDGRYEVVISHSPRFRRHLPELLNVPGFTGIRIHAGNEIEDTHGCILVGFGLMMRQNVAVIQYSREAIEMVISEINRLLGHERVFINVVSNLTQGVQT